MGKGWIVIVFLLIWGLDAAALPSKEIQINISIAKLDKLIKKYNSINTFDKTLYAKRVQTLKIISKKAKDLYELTGDIKFAKIHETYSNEAQDLIKRFYSQRDNAATEAKFRGRSKRILKPWNPSSQGVKIVPLTNFGNNLSATDRNLGELSKLTDRMDLSSLMADKAMTNLHRMIPADQSFQELRGGGSLNFAPSPRDMDTSYVAQPPRRLAQQQRRDAME